MTNDPARTLEGALVPPDFPIPPWARDDLWIALWDRDHGLERAIAKTQVNGSQGAFQIALDQQGAMDLALTGHRPAPHHVLSIGWGAAPGSSGRGGR